MNKLLSVVFVHSDEKTDICSFNSDIVLYLQS